MGRAKKSKAAKKATPQRAKPKPSPPIATSSPEPKPETAPPPVVTVPAPPPPSIADLGPPPDDELAAQAWNYKLLIASLDDIRQDPDLSPRERRKELRVQSAAAAKLLPRARLYQAEQLVIEHRNELRAKAKEKRGAALVPRPTRKNVVAMNGDVPSP